MVISLYSICRVVAVCLLCLVCAGAVGCVDEWQQWWEGSQTPDTLQEADRAFGQGFYLKAEKLYEQFLQQTPQSPKRWHAWWRLYEISGVIKDDEQKAIAILDALLLEYAAHPVRLVRVHAAIGSLHYRAGRHDAAIESLAEARMRLAMLSDTGRSSDVLSPAFRCELILQLAHAYRAVRSYDRAIATLRDCDPAWPCAADCDYTLAVTYSLIDNLDAAREILTRMASNPELSAERHAVAAFLLADVYLRDEDPRTAYRLLSSIRETHPNPRAVEMLLERIEGQLD